MYFLDLNVLLALAWPSHVHHAASHAWFSRQQTQGWATCPTTESGFIRVSSNPAFTKDAVSPAEARQILVEMAALPHHHFWPDELAWSDAAQLTRHPTITHRQVTDSYLVHLAVRHRAKLATFDKGIVTIARTGAEQSDSVELILA